MIVPVVLSGGSGSRLWPLSTPDQPKQFLPLTSDVCLFKQTVRRVADRTRFAAPIIVSNAAHEALCRANSEAEEGRLLILEPIARNTAAAIVMAAVAAQERHGVDALLLIMPSDHRIGEPEIYQDAIDHGMSAARHGRLVTFGIRPNRAETGYGYIETGKPLADAPSAVTVRRFTEKPSREVAETMVAGGRHFWNAGIFLFAADAFLAEANRFAPEIASAAIRAMAEGKRQDGVVRPAPAPLDACPGLSVDHAVLEHSEKVAMVRLEADWSDVGSWDALAELPMPAPADGLITSVQSSNCYVRSEGLKVALLGVDDLIVVATGEHVLIMRKGESQKVRQLLSKASAG